MNYDKITKKLVEVLIKYGQEKERDYGWSVNITTSGNFVIEVVKSV